MDSAPVAQLDRVLGYEPIGRGFESLQVRHPFLTPQRFKTFSTLKPQLFLHYMFFARLYYGSFKCNETALLCVAPDTPGIRMSSLF